MERSYCSPLTKPNSLPIGKILGTSSLEHVDESDIPVLESSTVSNHKDDSDRDVSDCSSDDNVGHRNISLAGRLFENRLVTQVDVHGVKYRALFDTGAQVNMIPENVLLEAGLNYTPTSGVNIRGFGAQGLVVALGEVDISIKLHGINLEMCKFLVMKEEHVGNLIILGLECLKQNGLIFDLYNRKISKLFNCGSVWNLSLIHI